MSKTHDIEALIAQIARELPQNTLNSMCSDLNSMQNASYSEEIESITRKISPPEKRELLYSLLSSWNNNFTHLSPQSISLALKTAQIADEYRLKQQQSELIWTGPTSPGNTFRRTDMALLELINSAQKHLLIVSFVVYKVEALFKALIQASERGVKIDFITESKTEGEGKITFETVKSIDSKITEIANFYIWPKDQRPHTDQGLYGSLHTKCAVSDKKTAFLSSANLTEYALSLNMEMGILIKGGSIPLQINDHFENLIYSRVLKRLYF